LFLQIKLNKYVCVLHLFWLNLFFVDVGKERREKTQTSRSLSPVFFPTQPRPLFFFFSFIFRQPASSAHPRGPCGLAEYQP
jgi:hypothetical protein